MYTDIQWRIISFLSLVPPLFSIFFPFIPSSPKHDIIEGKELIGADQAGFRKEKSTIDQFFTVILILEKIWEYKIEFIKFLSKPMIKLTEKKLYKITLYFGIPEKLIRLRKLTM
jgi:hypothetical protein